jgi:hypothetical protein
MICINILIYSYVKLIIQINLLLKDLCSILNLRIVRSLRAFSNERDLDFLKAASAHE